MKCPLLAFAWGNEGGKEPLVYPDCLGEECAGWDKLAFHCSLISIMLSLDGINRSLSAISRKMPHEE